MRLKLRTRVTIAQSIITKVKRSLYVTIVPTPFQSVRRWHIVPSAARLSILYCHGANIDGFIITNENEIIVSRSVLEKLRVVQDYKVLCF